VIIQEEQKTIIPREQSEKPRCPTCSANCNDSAQLFREYNFGKYNDKAPYTKMHNDPSLNYKVYNGKGFLGHCKNMLKRIHQCQSLGTWLDIISLRALFDLDNPTPLLDQGRAQAPLPI
jgi:hypothetical protein